MISYIRDFFISKNAPYLIGLKFWLRKKSVVLKGHKYIIDTVGVTKSHRLTIDTIDKNHISVLILQSAGKVHTCMQLQVV